MTTQENQLISAIYLALENPQLVADLKEVLEKEEMHRWCSIEELPSYFGNQLGVLPLCSMMIRNSTTSAESEKWNGIFLNWLRTECYLPLDGYIFGCSAENDDFIPSTMPAFVVLCAAVAGERGTFRLEMCATLLDIIEQLGLCHQSAQIAAWICHLTSRFEMLDQYNEARDVINSVGGINKNDLYCPPSLACDEYDCDDSGLGRITCPEMHEFRKSAFAQHEVVPESPCDIALIVLCDESFMSKWSIPILSTLWNH